MAGRLTDLQAVNQMLSAVGIRQVASVSDEAGSDDASDALRVLYRYSTIVQTRGWAANTLRGIGLTASGGSNTIDLTIGSAITPLRIECVAPGKWAGQVEMKGNNAFIVTENTTNFGSAVTVYFDIVHELDFEDACPPDLQYAIITEATKAFQMDRRANELVDRQLAEQAAKAEISANRGRGPRPTEVHTNDRPIVFGSDQRS